MATWFLNRYIPLLGYLPTVLSYFITVSLPFCAGLHVYRDWLMVVIQVFASVLGFIRAHALYGQSRRVLGFLVFTGVVSFIITTVRRFPQALTWRMYIPHPFFLKGVILGSHYGGGEEIPVLSGFVGCSEFTPSLGGRLATIAWVNMLVIDSVTFSLTLYKAFTIGRGIRLLDVIVRDGTMYFFIVFIMNLVNILILRYSPPLRRTSTTVLTNVLSSTLMSRLVLNLREQNSTLSDLPTTVESELRFQAALPSAQKSMTSNGNIPPVCLMYETATPGVVGASYQSPSEDVKVSMTMRHKPLMWGPRCRSEPGYGTLYEVEESGR
ncbi:hypothetical protein BC827DRAFT_1250848 [Russula dissimulans]|nr:hypothetical protein BC827DRAFT_1250848 [Russula dissimulans]